ncbi:MAG: branched-chain amino acid transporter AzlD [Clostridia bacterium]|nr:branched-chain amino acid transporter AzlD [Clostridia bacterium]NCC75661.1 branched-chain amino acid transporter AzlD [Clostridia bacterium]
MFLSPLETMTIIGLMMLATMITRFLPFVLFPADRETHPYITYLGKVLPYAVIGFLVVYCLKGVDVLAAPHGLPEALAIGVIVALQLWKGNSLVSIGAGTAVYMVLVQGVLA